MCEVQIIRKRSQTIESFHTCEQSTLKDHVQMSHVTHTLMNHVARTSAKCRLSLKDLIRKSHLAHMNKSCRLLHTSTNSRLSFMGVRVRECVYLCVGIYTLFYDCVYISCLSVIHVICAICLLHTNQILFALAKSRLVCIYMTYLICYYCV